MSVSSSTNVYTSKIYFFWLSSPISLLVLRYSTKVLLLLLLFLPPRSHTPVREQGERLSKHHPHRTEKKEARNTREKGHTYPISLGKKYELAASMIRPRLAKTKPILASAYAIRMAMGRVIVMPTPTADPLIAAMTGLRHW